MRTLDVTITDDLALRLDRLARTSGLSLDACLQTAMIEFVEAWERHLDDLHRLDDNEARSLFMADVAE